MSVPVVIDASAMVELLVRGPRHLGVAQRIAGCELHTPAHFEVEVLSALGRLCRAGSIRDHHVEGALDVLRSVPIEPHHVPSMLMGAWRRRHRLRLADALYAELSDQLGLTLVTCDRGLAAAASQADFISS
jgi:predicted nucleic acid-binding protein